MRSGSATATLLLVVWQAAPIQVEPDSNGPYRVTFGYGGGQYESRELSCSGDVLSAQLVDFRSTGVQFDAWPDRRFRLTAFGGVHSDDADYDGPFGGVQIAAEGQKVGFGLGATRVPGQGPSGPSLYLRLGNIDRPHFRMDFLQPSPTLGTTGWARIGVGFNQGHLRGVGGFFGFGVGPYSDQSHVGGPFGEVLVPVGHRFDLAAWGSWRASEQFGDWGLGLGGRYSLGP